MEEAASGIAGAVGAGQATGAGWAAGSTPLCTPESESSTLKKVVACVSTWQALVGTTQMRMGMRRRQTQVLNMAALTEEF